MITSPTAGFVTPEEISDVAVTTTVTPWQGRVLTAAGLALLPWLGYLTGTLPPAEAALWVPLDALEAVALLIAGTRLLCGDTRYRAPAAAAAVLLLIDACLDLATTSEPAIAVAMAVGVELPLVTLCAALATDRRIADA